MDEERIEQEIGLGGIESALECLPGGGRVTERVLGDRLQQESLDQPGRPAHRSGAVQDRREHGHGRVRVLLREPEPRRRDAHLPAAAILLAQFGEGLLGALDVAEVHQREQPERPRPRGESVRAGQKRIEPFGGAESGQRAIAPAARQLDAAADEVDRQRGRGLGFGPEGTLGALHPGFGLLEPALPDQHAREHRVGDADAGLVGPAIPPGQPDGLPAALLRPRERPEDLHRRLQRQAGALEKRPPDPARQRDPLR